MQAGANEWRKIVKLKDSHTKLGCWTRVGGFELASLATRSFVSSVQNGSGTIYRPAALGSCLQKTHSLAKPQSRNILVQANWSKATIRIPIS